MYRFFRLNYVYITSINKTDGIMENRFIRSSWLLSLLWVAKLYRALHNEYSYMTYEAVVAMTRGFKSWDNLHSELGRFIMSNGEYTMKYSYAWVKGGKGENNG